MSGRSIRREPESRTIVADGEAAKALASRAMSHEREREDPESEHEGPNGTDLAPVRRYRPDNLETQDEDVMRVLNTIPEGERAQLKFKFQVRKPGPKGGIQKHSIGEYNAFGDDWQNKIKEDIAKNRGPGDFEGTAYDHQDRLIPDAKRWIFQISEEIARENGWEPIEEKKTEENKGPIILPAPSPVKPAVVVELDPVAKAKQEVELAKVNIELEKAKQDLERVKKSVQPDEESKKPVEQSMNNDKLIDERVARIRAEEEAKGARALAEKEAELMKLKSDKLLEFEKEKAVYAESKRALEAALAEEKRKSETTLAEERRKAETDLAEQRRTLADEKRKSDEALVSLRNELDKKFEDLNKNFTKESSKRPDYADIASAIGAALAPIANAFAPLGQALVTKLSEPPPKPPAQADPADMVKSIAEVMDRFKPKEVKQPDMTELLTKTFDLVRAAQPAPLPPAPVTPPIDTMEIMQKTVNMLKAAQASQPQPAPVAPPEDPSVYMERVMTMAERFANLGGRNDRDEEGTTTTDTLDMLVQGKEKLGKIGIPIQIGQKEPEQKTWIRDLAEAGKELLPAMGKAVAESGYFNRPAPPQPPPPSQKDNRELALAIAEKRRRQAILNQQMQRKRALAAQQQAQRAQLPPAQPAPQPRPQQPQVQQAPRPQQPQQPHVQVPQQPRAQAPQQPAPQVPKPTVPPQPPKPPVAPQPANKFTPPTSPAYNLPTEKLPARLEPRPGFVPTESLPQRPVAPPAPMPVENIPTQVVTPEAQEAARKKAAWERDQMAKREAAKRAAVERVAAARAQGAQVEATPAKPQQGPSTGKVWGDICKHLLTSIRTPEDPEVTASYLSETYPAAINEIMSQSGGNVTLVEVGLTALAASVGVYGPIVAELASAIRVDPGRAWATQLLNNFKKGN